jgi:hypothetical protein
MALRRQDADDLDLNVSHADLLPDGILVGEELIGDGPAQEHDLARPSVSPRVPNGNIRR